MNKREHGQRRASAIHKSRKASLIHLGEIAPALIKELNLTVTAHRNPRKTFLGQVGTRGYHAVNLPGKQRTLLRLVKTWYKDHAPAISIIWPLDVLEYLHDFSYAAGEHGAMAYPIKYYDLALTLLDRMDERIYPGNCPPLVFAMKTREVMIAAIDKAR